MLLSIFSNLYQLISGVHHSVPDYVDEVYDNVGVPTLIIVVIITAIFYLLLGRWKPVFFKTGHWIFTLLLTAIIAVVFAFTSAIKVIGESDSYMFRFSLMNGILAAILFFILSTVLKRLSIFAKRTPF
ncbi:hypothetical protein ACFSR6_20695 [Pedobacter vanadiisoli]|uniref:Uncharacterized protein n=1 Tax=Pedobacter vanadiisoli TaxID=1761975 RepID=A0ABW5MRB8_9SPHI